MDPTEGTMTPKETRKDQLKDRTPALNTKIGIVLDKAIQ